MVMKRNGEKKALNDLLAAKMRELGEYATQSTTILVSSVACNGLHITHVKTITLMQLFQFRNSLYL